jgi:phage/plasmid-associated DNA primase
MTTNYDYDDNYDPKYELELNNIIDTIFPDSNIKHTYLTILSMSLSGLPSEKFIVASGNGGNGKGFLHELIASMMNDYYYLLPVDKLTSTKLKDGADPALANLHNKRLVICREPNATYKLNTSVIKEITGGDEINSRALYSNNTTCKLSLTLIMECNKKPLFDEVNDAVSRRLINIPFKSSFIDQDKYDELDIKNKYIYPINKNYKDKTFKITYRQALFNILIKYYKTFTTNGLILPNEIKLLNNEYLAFSDDKSIWIKELYDFTNNTKDVIKIKDIFNKFKTSDLYINLSKEQRRTFNYKHFITDLQSNIFLKNYIDFDNKNIFILKCYKLKLPDNDTSSDDL